jgi:hypothetical protein
MEIHAYTYIYVQQHATNRLWKYTRDLIETPVLRRHPSCRDTSNHLPDDSWYSWIQFLCYLTSVEGTPAWIWKLMIDFTVQRGESVNITSIQWFTSLRYIPYYYWPYFYMYMSRKEWLLSTHVFTYYNITSIIIRNETNKGGR